MKKLTALLLALLMLMSFAALAACDGGNSTNEPDTQTNSDNNTNNQTNPTNTDSNLGNTESNTTPTTTDKPAFHVPEQSEKLDGTVLIDRAIEYINSIDTSTLDIEAIDNSLPCEYIPEKLALGREVTVAYSGNVTTGVGAAQEARYQEEFPRLGINFISTFSNGDMPLMITQIENFVTMGVSCILNNCPDADLVQPAVTLAEENGTHVIFFSAVMDYFVAGNAAVDLDGIGFGCGMMAVAYADQYWPEYTEPGSIKTAVFRDDSNTFVKILGNGISRAVASDPRFDVVYTNSEVNGIDAGFTAAQEAHTMAPDLKLVVSYNLQAAFGADNYFCSLPGVNYDDYAVCATNADVSMYDFMERAANGEGTFRGTYTDSSDIAYGMLQCWYDIYFDHVELPYEYWVTGQPIAIFDYDNDAYFAQYYTPVEG